jgi:hypothetical protein
MKWNVKFAVLTLSLSLPALFAQNITPSDAAKHVGERATVCGKIVGEHTAAQSRGRPMFINLDRAYPDQVFTVVVWDEDRASVGSLPTSGDICVIGKITLYRGVPEIALRNAKSWSHKKAQP